MMRAEGVSRPGQIKSASGAKQVTGSGRSRLGVAPARAHRGSSSASHLRFVDADKPRDVLELLEPAAGAAAQGRRERIVRSRACTSLAELDVQRI